MKPPEYVDFDLELRPAASGWYVARVLASPRGEALRQIVGALAEKERVTIVVKSILPEAESLLGEISPGSRIRKAPRDLLSSGAQRMRRRTEPSTQHSSPGAKGSVL